jgi:mannitol/fructose-specific phosphotransferase system IIA component (Ntr-type)
MTLADFTSPGLVIPRLSGEDAASVIQELSQALRREKRVPDLLPFYHAALNHEFLVGSNLEAGLAFPHARLPGLGEIAFALGRSDEPLGWWSQAARSVRLVFLVAVPATDSTRYLLLCSGFARLSKDAALVERLLAAPDASAMLEALRQIKLQNEPPPGILKTPQTSGAS